MQCDREINLLMIGEPKSKSTNDKTLSFFGLIFGIGLVWDAGRHFLTAWPKLSPPANTSERVTLDVAYIVFLLAGAWLARISLRKILEHFRKCCRPSYKA